MKVSIVTISYNQVRYLPRAMASVLSQDYPDVEYIVVDPGSTDGSREVISDWAGRLSHVVLEPDRGPADGLNHGFRLATGDVLGYVNADDALLPGAIREAVDYLLANDDVDVVYGDGYLIDMAGRVIRSIESSPFSLRRYSYGHVTVLQPATFIRSAAFRRAGGFNPYNRISWDGELVIDVALTGGKLRHVPRQWAVWTIHPEAISSSPHYFAQWRLEMDRLFGKMRGREPRGIDILLSRIVRVEKWLVSPRTTFRRLWGALWGPPRLTLTERDGPRVELTARDRLRRRGGGS